MTAIAARLDEGTAEALAGLRVQLLTEPPPAPRPKCAACGQVLPDRQVPQPVLFPVFRAPGEAS